MLWLLAAGAIGWSALASLLAASALLAYRKWRCERIMGPHISRPPEWPLLGVGPRFVGKDNEAVLALIDELLGSVPTPCRVWFGPMLVIGISRPEDMQVVLSSTNCLEKGYMYRFMHNEYGLFTSRPAVWREHRRHLNPTFSQKGLHRHVPVFNAKSRRMCDIIEAQLRQHERNTPDEDCGCGTCIRPMTLDVYHAIFMCTLDITVNTVMSMQSMEMQNDKGERFYTAFTAAFESVARRMYRVWQIPDFVYQRTAAYRDEMLHFRYGHQLIDEIIERKRTELDGRLANDGVDVLDEERRAGTLTYLHKCFWLWQRGTFDRQQVRDEVETILIGGIDTTSVTVTHTVLMLAIHPEVQQRCVREMETVFGRRRWWNRAEELDIGQEDVAGLVYLKQVVHESLRLFPAGPFLSRQCDGDLPLSHSTIPSGSVVLLLINRLHRDPATWGPTGDQFDPDRFQPELVEQRHPWSFLPFSGGPRNCIGIKHASLSVRIMLTQLLRRFRFRSGLRLEDVRIKMDITTKVVNEDAVWAERRETPADLE